MYRFLLVGGVALLAGCQAHRPLYYWGNYETLVYQSYVSPEKAPPERQIEKLNEDVQKASAANLSVAPGVHAHLGYLHYRLGHLDQATKEFDLERKLFPESATFIDTLLKAPTPKPEAPAENPVAPKP